MKFFRTILVLTLVLLLLAGCGDKEEVNSGEGTLSGEMEISESMSEPSEPSEPSEASSETEAQSSAAEGSGAESGDSVPVSVSGDSDNLLILVNPWNYIPDDYTLDLETVQGDYKMNKLAADAAKDLIAAAAADGYSLRVCSGYRTVEKSRILYERKVQQYLDAGYSEADAKTEAAKWVAPPGTSEHHTGLAMDIVSADYFNYYSDLEHDFDKFDEFDWLIAHCAEYGFILRYPEGKEDITGITYEPWHYRYVGKEAAEVIMSEGLCLEEYLEQYGP
ncbi:MAG TPA: M15 family metallopeptidase [Oscillospiraceae bacterium]|nr:M15 family metallopeptidase [Oscillospiraceae bacterium]HRW57439.1 M15 family metallopeptidase [Oscillospiraceae bacterium]